MPKELGGLIASGEVGGVTLELPREEAPAIPQINSALISQGIKVAYLNLVQRTVEDIFLELIEKHDRGELSKEV